LKTDLRGSRNEGDVIGEQEVRKQEDVANATSLHDDRSDQPASTMEVWSHEEVRPTKPSLQEVLVNTTGLEQGGHAVDSGTFTSAIANDREEPTVNGEGETQSSDIDTSMSGPGDALMDEHVLISLPSVITCPTRSDLAPSGTLSQSPQNERQRPTRVANRPSRYQDSN